MADPRHRRKRPLALLVLLAACVVASPLLALGGIVSFAALMDLHGFTVTMRIAVVGAVAVIVVPACIFVGVFLCGRIDAKKHKAQLAALRYGAHSTVPRGQK